MTIYRLYGIQLATDLPLASYLPHGEGPADLQVRRVERAPVALDWGALPPRYRSPYQNAEGESTMQAYQAEGWELLRFTDVADFFLRGDAIACLVAAGAEAAEVEIALLGVVLACWLGAKGLPSLHASAACVGGGAAVFLATNRGGKTSLAAALSQAGHALLTDDLLPLEAREGRWWGRPGYPQMRMWPDAAAHFAGAARAETLPTVHPRVDKRRVPVGPDGVGRFAEASCPLRVLYLPERRAEGDADPSIRVEPLPPRDAVIELLRHSFAVRLVSALHSPQERLDTLASLAEQVPLRRLRYPHGYEHLPRVRDAILADLERGA